WSSRNRYNVAEGGWIRTVNAKVPADEFSLTGQRETGIPSRRNGDDIGEPGRDIRASASPTDHGTIGFQHQVVVCTGGNCNDICHTRARNIVSTPTDNATAAIRNLRKPKQRSDAH